MRHVLSVFLVGLIKLYQILLGPLMGGRCRFYPSCSAYGEESIRRYGPFYGSWLTIRRILKCHPFHPGGVDYPP